MSSEPLPNFTIGEINIICTDLERSLQFYCDVLGFEPLEREDPGYHLRCGDVRVLLLAVATSGEIMPYCSNPEISIDLMVDDLLEAYRHLTDHGATIVSEFEPNSDRFFIRDPDGLVFEVIQHR